MSQTIVIILLIVIILVGVSVFYLIPKETSTQTIPISASKEEAKEILDEILNKWESITSVKYDMILETSKGGLVTIKTWQKKNKLKSESTFRADSLELKNIISFVDMETKKAYGYLPNLNIIISLDFDKVEKPPNPKEIRSYGPTLVGTQKIDGKESVILEYMAEGAKIRIWVWREKGFPLRIETTLPHGEWGIISFKNIEFVDIPDSEFELPANAKQFPSLAEISGLTEELSKLIGQTSKIN
jgi:outer membrane lipoprotein-sorting protein